MRAAAELLTKSGRDAVSTRAVSAAADVQPPAIYRQFEDMQALLQAAARQILKDYVRDKAKRRLSKDPMEDLRRGWDEHIAFGVNNPDAYAILYSGAEESEPAREGMQILEALLTRVAETGRLRLNVKDAARLLHAGGTGVVFSLVTERDPALSSSMFEALIASMTVASPKPKNATKHVAPHAISLRAVLPATSNTLTDGERRLLDEWLERLASAKE